MIDIDELAKELATDEGERLFVYDDATGKPIRPGTLVKGHPTIGVGRCLDTHGISQSEARLLNGNDIHDVQLDLFANLPWFYRLDSVRQTQVANMAFALGSHGFLGFHGMLTYLEAAATASDDVTRLTSYVKAANEVLASAWAKQVGARATRIAERLRTGVA